MRVREMINALQLNKKDKKPNQLYTIWGDNLDESNIFPEYPRPQLQREHYTNLNGYYQYAFLKDDGFPKVYDGTILVPFSPECALSGVNRQLRPDEYLWYQKDFYIEKIFENKRLLLQFGACDERCRVYVNGKEAGRHTGGYQSFYFDITDEIVSGNNVLQIRVRDESDWSFHGRGKQKLERGGMFYTAQSGIWQTVWYEWVPDIFVEQLFMTPVYDEDSVLFSFDVKKGSSDIKKNRDRIQEKLSYKIEIFENDTCVSKKEGEYTGKEISLYIPDKKSWSPSSPFLYKVHIQVGEDYFESYFGMRLFSIEEDVDHIPRLCLNHVPFFQKGVLDQGYYPESLMTPPSDEAMIFDILTAKQLGFNMIRKHCKIEPARWYYHCDRLGMLVWQDMINGGGRYHLLFTTYIPTVIKPLRRWKDNHYSYTARQNEKGRREWKKECLQTIKQLYNATSICTWVLFNEGWGQFDATKNTEMVRSLDHTRWIDAHSGWLDQDAGDLCSEHIYFSPLFMKKTQKPYVISECGGFSYPIESHIYTDNFFGYGTYHQSTDYEKVCYDLQKQIRDMKPKGLCGIVYTQLTDIEEEVNGLITYDRKVIKVSKRC